MKRHRTALAAICIAAASMSSACATPDETGAHVLSEAASAPAGHGEPAAPAQAAPPRDSTREPGALGSVIAAPVLLWKGPGDHAFEVTLRTADPSAALARRFGTITMRTSLRVRAPDLGQYPCSSCHMGRSIVMADARRADAHQNIKAVHPVQTGGVCSTCHAPDNVESLALKSGERAALDHAYRLCAQCHFSQAESWAGGAHGKRLDGWQGRRVLMGCADCHDPHKPALEPRIPFRAPQIERTRGGSR